MKNNKFYTIIVGLVLVVFVLTACTPKLNITKVATPTPQNTNEVITADETDNPQENNMTQNETMKFTGDAFNFDLTDVNGKTYKLSDLQGKKVYIKFWATWCSICLAGMKEFIEFDNSYKTNDDVIILTMVAPGASGEMKTEKFKEWYASQNLDFVALLDEGGSVMREYGIRGFPTSIFINTNGNIHETRVGHVDNAAIEQILSQVQ